MQNDSSKITILDGGLATELEARGATIDTPLWSAELLLSNPDAIVAAHEAFLEAGAEVITSASYQASRAGFHQLGIDAGQVDRLLAASVSLAAQAVERHANRNPGQQKARVAASVGPYGAVLANGSEYHGNYGVASAVLRRFHAARLPVLDAAGADCLAVETIPSLAEAEILAELLSECNTPAWVAFSCRDGERIADGTRLAEAVARFDKIPGVFAVGINCTAPEQVLSLLSEARSGAPSKALIVYPNSGETWDASRRKWLGDWYPEAFVDAAGDWIAAGASFVGGCCRVRPAHIRALADSVR